MKKIDIYPILKIIYSIIFKKLQSAYKYCHIFPHYFLHHSKKYSNNIHSIQLHSPKSSEICYI